MEPHDIKTTKWKILFINAIPIICLSIIALASNFLLIVKPGIFQDDWFLYASKFAHISLYDMFKIDRPGLGIYFDLIKSILGYNIIVWKIYIILLKIVSGFVFYILIGKIFNTRKIINLIVSSFLIIYPGFLQTGESITYQSHYFAFIICMLSIYITLICLTKRKIFVLLGLYIISIFLEITYLSMLDYFIGMEIVRIAIVYLYLRDDKTNWKKRILHTIKQLSPNIIIAVVFVIWKLFIFPSARNATNPTLILSNLLSETFLS